MERQRFISQKCNLVEKQFLNGNFIEDFLNVHFKVYRPNVTYSVTECVEKHFKASIEDPIWKITQIGKTHRCTENCVFFLFLLKFFIIFNSLRYVKSHPRAVNFEKFFVIFKDSRQIIFHQKMEISWQNIRFN